MLAVFNSRQKWLLIHVSVSLCRILLLECDDGKTNIAIEKVGDGGCQHQFRLTNIIREDSFSIDLELALCRWYNNAKFHPPTSRSLANLSWNVHHFQHCDCFDSRLFSSTPNYFEMWRGCTVTVMPVRLNNIMQFPT